MEGLSFSLPFPFPFNIPLNHNLPIFFWGGWHFIFPLVLWLKYGRVQGERNDDHNSGGISKLLYLSYEQMLISHSLLVTHKVKEESLMVFFVF